MIVELPLAPARTVAVVGLADKVKAGGGPTLYVMVVECDSDPLVALTVTWNVPDDEKLHESVAFPEPFTLVGPSVQAVLSVVSVTVPLNPFSAVTDIADVSAEPALVFTLVGLALTV